MIADSMDEDDKVNGKDTIDRLLYLPSSDDGGEEHVLSWKAKNGALVHSGEVLALAIRRSDMGTDTSDKPYNATGAATAASSDDSGGAASTAVKHKRPTRRKRTSAPVGETKQRPALNPGEELKSIKLKIGGNSTDTNSTDKDESSPNIDTSSESSSNVAAKKQQQAPQPAPIVAPLTGFLRIGKPPNSTGKTGKAVIGYIEVCSHPTVMSGMCAVCGEQLSPARGASNDHDSGNKGPAIIKNNTKVTVSGGLTFSVSEEEGQRMALQNSQRLRRQRKLSLILDLDHTLVHATADMRARVHLGVRDDVRSLVLPMTDDPNATQALWMQHFVKLRPHVTDFFKTLLPLYEIGVYTAGTRQYAEQIAIVLCRAIVGANRDQMHLDQLRYDVSQAEMKLQQQQQQPREEQEKATKLLDKKNGSRKTDPEGDDTPEENEGRKRKRVMFAAEPPSHSRESNLITAEQVEALKDELKEAERLEVEAIEMRKRVFGSRLVSRTDVRDLGRDVKSLRRIFPCGGTMAAVVDDREDVWANANDNYNEQTTTTGSRSGEPPENLLLVRPYHWEPFVGFADINNASGVDFAAESDGSDKQSAEDASRESDFQLLWTADILKRVHARFYDDEQNSATTVPELLSDMRKGVLRGTKVVLSGLVPLHEQNLAEDSRIPRHPIVRYAESLGTEVLSAVQPDTTHVVASKDGTDKIVEARLIPGCSVVKVSWLMECFWSLRRRDEQHHLLRATEAIRSAPLNLPSPSMSNGVTTTTTASGESGACQDNNNDDDESVDDDFAAGFEQDLM